MKELPDILDIEASLSMDDLMDDFTKDLDVSVIYIK